MNIDKGQPVGAGNPERRNGQQRQCQQADLAGSDGENVSDQILVVFGKAAAAQRGDENAKRHRGTGKHADQGIRRLIAPAAHKGEHQREYDAEHNGNPGRRSRAADTANCNTGKGGMPKGIGEEAHPPCDDHGGHQTEQRRHDDNGQQGVFHEIPVEHFQWKPVAECVPDAHNWPPFV